MSLGSLIKQQGDVRRARDLLAEGLRLCNQVGAKLPIPSVLEEFGELAAEGQQRDSDIRAVQLYGAAEALSNTMGIQRFVDPTRTRYQATITTLRARLGESAYAAAWAEGRTMSLQQAIAYALNEAAASIRPTHQTS